jgi:hypothetical protein
VKCFLSALVLVMCSVSFASGIKWGVAPNGCKNAAISAKIGVCTIFRCGSGYDVSPESPASCKKYVGEYTKSRESIQSALSVMKNFRINSKIKSINDSCSVGMKIGQQCVSTCDSGAILHDCETGQAILDRKSRKGMIDQNKWNLVIMSF